MRILVSLTLGVVLSSGCSEVRIVETETAGGQGGATDDDTVSAGDASGGGTPCDDLSSDPLSCGACAHDCEGGACLEGACQPVIIATDFLPGALAIDESFVYVTRSDSGDLLRIAKGGGAPEIVSHGDAEAWSIALTDADAFWGGAEGIWRAPKTGGSAQQIMSAPFRVGPIATDGWTVVFATVEAFGRVGSVPAGGGPDQTLVPYASQAYDVGLHSPAKDYSSVYWVSQDAAVGELHRLRLDGQSVPAVVAGGMGYATDLLVAPEGVYVVDSGFGAKTLPSGGTVARVNPSGTIEQMLAKDGTPASVAISDEWIYVSMFGTGALDGMILRVGRLQATGIQVIATGLAYPVSLAADEHALYWIQQEPGAVLKLVL